jgi:DUF3037 family protein
VPPSRDPFDYAVVRVVPDIARGEFVNAGLILFCRPQRYLAARTRLDEEALATLRPGGDVDGIREQLAFIEGIAGGTVASGPFATMTQSERFHWLTTPRSTVVQPGPLHAGTTEDAAATFERLFEVMVDR